MKRVLGIVFIIFSLYSCNIGRGTHGADGYHISGKITNCTVKLVLLEKLSPEGFTNIDSATIDSKGNFTFKGTIKEPLFCALRFDPNMPAEKRVFIVIDSNTKVKVDADYKFIEDYKVNGSKDCELLQQLLAINKIMEGKLKVLDAKFAAYDPNNIPDSVGRAARKEYAEIIKEQETSIDKFVSDNNSFTIYFAGLFMMQAPPIPLLQKIDTKGMPLYGSSRYAQIVHEFVLRKQKIAVGAVAPDINLKDMDDKNLPLSSLRGQYVLIDFWASWCGPCRRENPNNLALYTKYHGKGFEIYGVSIDDTKEKWISAVATDKLPWKHVNDPASSVSAVYDVSTIPQTYLLDKEGKIIAIGLRGEQLTEKLEELFGK